MVDPVTFTPQLTADGSFTFFSTEFNQTFHSQTGAREEAELKFIAPTRLQEKAAQSCVKILDICYGLGYNTAAALATIWAVNPNCRVEWVGLEFDPNVVNAAIAHHLLQDWPSPIPKLLTDLASTHQVNTEQFQGQLLLGDARQTIQHVCERGFQADGIFLDPFSPPSCPQLWTVEFLSFVARCLTPTGILATYSCSAAIRKALILAGLKIGASTPVGRRSPGTVAGWIATDLPPLSVQEQEHLQTRAAIPYRDPHLSGSADAIIQRRENEQKASCLEFTSEWKKRWYR